MVCKSYSYYPYFPPVIIDYLNGALIHLQNTQEKNDLDNKRFKGEWPTFIFCENDTFYCKPGEIHHDANIYTVANITNILTDIYVSQNFREDVKKMVHQAIDSFASYYENGKYYFWHEFNLPDHIDNGRGIKIRRPSEFEYKITRFPKIIKDETTGSYKFKDTKIPALGMIPEDLLFAAGNFEADLDDTAIAVTAINKYLAFDPDFQPPFLNEDVLQSFAYYRNIEGIADEYRKQPASRLSSGAFLTFTEDDSMPLLPDTTFKRKYMPFGISDCDCVVNANALLMLSITGQSNTFPGYQEACNFINASFENGNQFECGIYYPSEYSLHYVTARAIASGVECLENSTQQIVDELISSQQNDGSWRSSLPRNDVHTTLLALNTLLYLVPHTDIDLFPYIETALNYVMLNATSDGNCGLIWQGGAFFSAGVGGTRNDLVWRSDEYTTALAAEAFSKYLEWIN